MDVDWASVQVQACNPLAPAGRPLYYYHTKQQCTITSSSCAGTSEWQVPSTWTWMSLDECYKSSQVGVSFQSEVSEVRCLCCALLSWWPTMPDSCLEQAIRFSPAHPVTTNACWTSAFGCFHCYQIGCLQLQSPMQGHTTTGLLKWIACWSLAICCSRRSEAAWEKNRSRRLTGKVSWLPLSRP